MTHQRVVAEPEHAQLRELLSKETWRCSDGAHLSILRPKQKHIILHLGVLISLTSDAVIGG